jgi:hypothetical protein
MTIFRLLLASIEHYKIFLRHFSSVYDASVKSPVGIEFGTEYQLGNFDQCMNISTNFDLDGVNIEPKYCLLDVKIDDYTVRRAAFRSREVSSG